VADIPGLIEGASKGVGLGLTFLRHVERTKLLIHLLDISEAPSRNPVEDFRSLNEELRAYQASLEGKPQILALNKIDLPEVQERASGIRTEFEKMGHPLHLVSGRTGEGVDALMKAVVSALEAMAQPSDGQ
jgi:GTP-binding protein